MGLGMDIRFFKIILFVSLSFFFSFFFGGEGDYTTRYLEGRPFGKEYCYCNESREGSISINVMLYRRFIN